MAQRLMVEIDADSEAAKALLAGENPGLMDGVRVVGAQPVAPVKRTYLVLVRDEPIPDGKSIPKQGEAVKVRGVGGWKVQELVSRDEYSDAPEGITDSPF